MSDKMNLNHHQFREALVLQADSSYYVLLDQINKLFDHISFYADRYPATTPSDDLRYKELATTVESIGSLSGHLAHELQKWKIGTARTGKWQEIELNVLIEIWSNVLSLVYFITFHGIDLDPFNQEEAHGAFVNLVRANRLLT